MAECGLCSAEYAEEEKEVSTEGRSLDVQGRGARGAWRAGVVADKRPMGLRVLLGCGYRPGKASQSGSKRRASISSTDRGRHSLDPPNTPNSHVSYVDLFALVSSTNACLANCRLSSSQQSNSTPPTLSLVQCVLIVSLDAYSALLSSPPGTATNGSYPSVLPLEYPSPVLTSPIPMSLASPPLSRLRLPLCILPTRVFFGYVDALGHRRRRI